MTHVPVKLYLRHQIWSRSAGGNNPAGYGLFDDADKARAVMEARQKELDQPEKKSK